MRFEGERLVFQFADQRELAVPVAWFPWLADATPAQRANWQLIVGNEAVLWPELDEVISGPGLLGLPD